MKIVFELPHHSITCGGVRDLELLATMMGSHVRFQEGSRYYPQLDSWSIGIPDKTFPESDVCVTYSDTPYLKQLLSLPQVKKVIVYMMSYGMSIERELPNATNKDVTVICITKKIQKAIKHDGGNAILIGTGLVMDDMYNENKERKNYLAILYHDVIIKRYSMAVQVADELYKDGIIDGVITFGRLEGYNSFKHPQGLVRHYSCASRNEVREIFNMCKCYLMPSCSEGLNLTTIESTLCGCPAVMCDGAIGEIFFNGKNCVVVKTQPEMYNQVSQAIKNFEKLSVIYEKSMKEIVKNYKWENVKDKLYELCNK